MKNRLSDCQVPLDLKAIIPVYFIEMVRLVNMVNPALFPQNKTKRLLYFNGEFDPSHPPSEGFSTQNYRSNFNFYKILLSSSLSKEVETLSKVGKLWLPFWTSQRKTSDNATLSWAAVTTSPMTAAFLRPTTHWEKASPRPPVVSRRRFPGASSIRWRIANLQKIEVSVFANKRNADSRTVGN